MSYALVIGAGRGPALVRVDELPRSDRGVVATTHTTMADETGHLGSHIRSEYTR